MKYLRVENGEYARYRFSGRHPHGLGSLDVLSVEGKGCEPVGTCQVHCAFVVKVLRHDDDFAEPEDVLRSHDRIECPKPRTIQHEA